VTRDSGITDNDHSKEGAISVSSAIDDAAALPKGTLDPVYEAKARILNHAIQSIGFGKYQLRLFCVVGFGWANDNLWPNVTALICMYISILPKFSVADSYKSRLWQTNSAQINPLCFP
jgi:hypothetical protein